MVHNYMRVLLLLRNVHGDDDAHVSSPVPPSSSASSGDTAAGTSSTAVAVEDPTPVPSSSGDTAAGTSSAAVAAEEPPPAPSAPALDNEVIGPEGVEAMSWALKTHDQALVRSVCNAVPSWCIKEQIHLFNRRDVDAVATVKPVKTVKLALDPSLLKDRMVLVEHLNAHISETHGDQWSRAPRGSILTFLKENVRWTRPHRRAVESVRRALLSWRKRRLADKGHCPQSRTLTLKDTPILKGSRFVWTDILVAAFSHLFLLGCRTVTGVMCLGSRMPLWDSTADFLHHKRVFLTR